MPAKIECTQELALEICEVVSSTPDMLEELCEQNPHWPSARFIYQWRIKDPSFGQMYAQAKAAQIEVLVSRIFTLARNKKGEYLTDAEGKTYADGVAMNNKRLEIDAIKWLSAKLAPKLYGDYRQNDDKDKDDFISKNRDSITR